ncbi:MAG: hypothetical protein JKX97_08345 [Candidatus Lindowbacteria bacterium]|nr:hypothetical protein [Candidatus Lindowbacteria bacterium]
MTDIKRLRLFGQSFNLVLILSLVFFIGGCTKSAPSSDGTSLPAAEKNRVGFDIDDTLLFSSGAFDVGKKSGYEFGTDEFWSIVNSSDRKYSLVKKSVLALVREHQEKGDEVYVITARRNVDGDPVKEYISEVFRVPKENIFFEPDGKTERLKVLKLQTFYGDSDSDISDAQAAGIEGVRIQRSPKSGYKKKYNPGNFGERVIENTEE